MKQNKVIITFIGIKETEQLNLLAKFLEVKPDDLKNAKPDFSWRRNLNLSKMTKDKVEIVVYNASLDDSKSLVENLIKSHCALIFIDSEDDQAENQLAVYQEIFKSNPKIADMHRMIVSLGGPRHPSIDYLRGTDIATKFAPDPELTIFKELHSLDVAGIESAIIPLVWRITLHRILNEESKGGLFSSRSLMDHDNTMF